MYLLYLTTFTFIISESFPGMMSTFKEEEVSPEVDGDTRLGKESKFVNYQQV